MQLYESSAKTKQQLKSISLHKSNLLPEFSIWLLLLIIIYLGVFLLHSIFALRLPIGL